MGSVRCPRNRSMRTSCSQRIRVWYLWRAEGVGFTNHGSETIRLKASDGGVFHPCESIGVGPARQETMFSRTSPHTHFVDKISSKSYPTPNLKSLECNDVPMSGSRCCSRILSIDEIYSKVKDYDLVITNDIALCTALNRRVDRTSLGTFCMTPRQIALRFFPSS